MNAVVRLNLDIDAGEASSSLRLKRAAESLKSLSPKFGRIVILSHRGRPAGTDKSLSLKPIIKELSAKSRRKITFLDGDPEGHIEKILMKKGIFALENTRFMPGENKNSPSLARVFASFGDVFINDDFATAHRTQASNVGITEYLTSLEGPIMHTELNALKKVMGHPARPFTLIVGGGKMSSKLPVIKNLLPKADRVLLGGGVGNTALKAAGYDIGKSIFESSLIPEAKKLVGNQKVLYPADFRISGKSILDIGPNTAAAFSDIIYSSKTVVWAGPLGMFEKKAFSRGTEAVARAIAKSDCFSVAGGGETTSAIISFGLENRFSFLSTGGGAMLEFLAGKKLPALEALRIKYR
jgi:phosphoglycerate kinase